MMGARAADVAHFVRIEITKIAAGGIQAPFTSTAIRPGLAPSRAKVKGSPKKRRQ
jgi:hypothetical protein